MLKTNSNGPFSLRMKGEKDTQRWRFNVAAAADVLKLASRDPYFLCNLLQYKLHFQFDQTVTYLEVLFIFCNFPKL